MELSNQTLIDRLVMNHVSVVDIEDVSTLIGKGILTNDANTKIKYTTSSGLSFDKLEVKGNGFRLTVKAALIGGQKVDVGILTLTVFNNETHNLYCQTVDDVYTRLLKVQELLLDEYGIIVDFSNLKIREIELNKTFELGSDFASYSRPIRLIMSNLPTKFKVEGNWKSRSKEGQPVSTYISKTKSKKHYEEFKVYDKTKQLQEEFRITLDQKIMRVELTLSGVEKVKKIGTTSFAELTDELINSFFNEQMEKLIVEPLKKWKKSRDKELLSMMKQEKAADVCHWQTNVLRWLTTEEIARNCPILLDIGELSSLLTQMGLSRSRKSVVLKSFRKECENKEHIFVQNDNKKLEEIVAGLFPEGYTNPTTSKKSKKACKFKEN